MLGGCSVEGRGERHAFWIIVAMRLVTSAGPRRTKKKEPIGAGSACCTLG